MLSCKKSFHGGWGGGNHPPPPQQVGSHVSLRLLRLLRFCQTLWLDRKIVRLPPKKGVIPWLCLHTSINPVSNFDLIYQLRYILLGINDIYEDLWKEYLSQKWLMKLSLLIGIMNFFCPLYSTVCHIIP